MEVILLDVLVVDRFVERDETPGEVADEEDDDDGAEHQCLTVLVGGVLRVGSRGHGACKGKQKSDPSNACAMKCITYKSSNRDCIVNSFFADFYEFLPLNFVTINFLFTFTKYTGMFSPEIVQNKKCRSTVCHFKSKIGGPIVPLFHVKQFCTQPGCGSDIITSLRSLSIYLCNG